MSKFKVGDKVRTLEKCENGYENAGYFPIGKEYEVSVVPPSQGIVCLRGVDGCWSEDRFELVEETKPVAPVVPQLPGIPEGYRAVRIGTPVKGEWFVGSVGTAKRADGGHFASCYTILEKIDQPEAPVESPEDLVIQDRVPARDGIDFGWWVGAKEVAGWVPHISKVWGMNSKRAGLMHGYDVGDGSCLVVMCYRKDLPVLPIAERVVLDEYLVWDTDGPKCLLWSDTNPTIETDYQMTWDHAYPTGNTREIEVPIV